MVGLKKGTTNTMSENDGIYQERDNTNTRFVIIMPIPIFL